MSDILRLISEQFEARSKHPTISSIKVNLYRNYEVEAVASALEYLSEFRKWWLLDCIMVADSYLMTHLQRKTTRLADHELRWFMATFLDLIEEVRNAITLFLRSKPLYLIADMPDGSYSSPELAMINADLMVRRGADVVKVEITSDEDIKVLERLVKEGIHVMAHVGYTPQRKTNRVYGCSYEEALAIFAVARKVRDSGACAIIVEKVTESVNRSLCTHRKNAIPVYSIFSGKSKYGGQSLNVWDSVVRPQFDSKFFPPTASIDVCDYPQEYTATKICKNFNDLLRLTFQQEFPLSPDVTMVDSDLKELLEIDPWDPSPSY